MEMLDKGVSHSLGRMDEDAWTPHHATQSSAQFKTYDFVISKIFHVIFSDHN